jgi:hypothetical protein
MFCTYFSIHIKERRVAMQEEKKNIIPEHCNKAEDSVSADLWVGVDMDPPN